MTTALFFPSPIPRFSRIHPCSCLLSTLSLSCLSSLVCCCFFGLCFLPLFAPLPPFFFWVCACYVLFLCLQLVVFLPALCRKLDIPYCIVKVHDVSGEKAKGVCEKPSVGRDIGMHLFFALLMDFFFFLVCCCCIVQSKSRLGRLVHQKKATCVALTDINTKDESEFNKLVDTLNTKYKSRFDEIRRSWGGQQLGHKTMAHLRQMAIAKERADAALRH